MELLALIVGIGGIALSVWVYYVFTNLAIAVWFPTKTNEKWLRTLEHPIVQYWRPFIKWIIPLCLILIIITLVLEAILHFLQ